MDENLIFDNPQSLPSQPLLKKIIKLVFGVLAVIFLGFVIFGLVVPILHKKPKSEKTTLLYWGLWEDSKVMQPIISDFERQYPNITVNFVKQDIKQYRERLVTRIQNGTGPDVFRFHNTWWPMLSNILVPLPKDTITKTDFEKWFYKVAQNDLVKNGAIYGIPLEIDTLSLYINTEVFKARGLSSPKDWIDFSNIARQLTVKDERGKIATAGAAVGTFGNITHAGDVVSLFLVQNGTDLNDISSTEQLASEALSFYTSFALNDKVWDDTFDPSVLSFAQGNLAMLFGYSRDFFTIKSIDPNLSFEIYPVPHLPQQNMTIASYWVEGVSIKSKYQKEAMLLIKYLAQKETQQKLFTEQSKTRAVGLPYGRRDLANLLKDNANVYPFISQAEGAISSFFASDTYDNGLNSQMNNYLEDAVNAILTGSSSQTAVDTLQKGVSQILQQYATK
ncbi:MAG: extracellular solute-binding protein [Patescibacteria group bacterium]